jgi:hypothetical protein
MPSPIEIIDGYFANQPAVGQSDAPMDDVKGRLISAIRGVESGGNPNAVSPQGASGSMQIMLGTFRQYALPGESYYNDAHRTAAAIRKIEDDWNYFNGDPDKVAAAYIGGRGAVLPDGTIRGNVRDAHGTSPLDYIRMIRGRMGSVEPYQSDAPPPADYTSMADAIIQASASAIGKLPPAPAKPPGMLGRLGDAAIDVGKGVVGAGEAVVGLAKLVPGVDKLVDMTGYDPAYTKQVMERGYTDARKQTEGQIAQARAEREGTGFLNEAGGAAADILRNPSVAIGRTLETLPSMLLGGTAATGTAARIYQGAVSKAIAGGASAEAAALAGRAALTAASGTLKTAGAVGEGLVSAGQTAQAIDEKGGNVYAAIPAGIATGIIGRAASAIPGFGDAETAALTGVGAAGATGGLAKRMAKGFVSEGLLQEVPQSAQEQAWQNVGTGDPLMKGVGVASGEGLALGGLTGMGFGAGHSPASNPRGMGNQTGEMLGAARKEENELAAYQKNLYPLRPDENGQMNILSQTPVQPSAAPAVNPAEAAAGPLAPESGLTGEQLDLPMGDPEPYQLDMFANAVTPPAVRPQDAGAGPLPAPAENQGTQLEMPMNQPRADFQAPAGTPSNQPIVTDELQATPNPDAKLALPANPTLFDMQLDARRKAQAGEVLSSWEAHLLTMPTPQVNPNAQIEVPAPANTKQVPTQGNLFDTPLDQPAAPAASQPASPVQSADPNQRSMFDAAGRPTLDAESEASPAQVAEQFAREFQLKQTKLRDPMLAAVGRLYYDGKIDFDEATSVAEQIRSGKNKAAAKSVQKLVTDSEFAKPAAAPVVEESTPAAPAETQATVTETPAETSVMGTPLEDTRAKNEDVIRSEDVKTAKIAELISAAEDGDHPHISSRDAEAEIARRFVEGSEPAQQYFTDNFPDEKERRAYLRQLAQENGYASQGLAFKGKAQRTTTKYRTRDGAGSKYVTRDEAEGVVKATTGKWKGAPRIEVVENVGGLPADIRSQAEADGVNPKGVYYQGKVWVVSDNHDSTGDVLTTILHEIAGHYGLQRLLGADFKKVMNQIYNGNADIRAKADQFMKDEGLSREVAVEEALADIAETGKIKTSVLEKIGNAIRKFLRSVGLGQYADGVTNAEVKELLTRAKQAVVEGGPDGPNGGGEPVYRTAKLADVPDPEPGTFMTRVQDKFRDIGTKSLTLGLMTRRQLVDRFSDVPALKALSDQVEAMARKAKQLQGEVDVLNNAFSMLNEDETKMVSKMMIDATVNEWHPDLDFRDGPNKHIDPVFEDDFNKFKAEYDAMPQKLKDIYQQVKAKFRKDWEETNELIRTRIIDQYRDDLPGFDVDTIAKTTKYEDRQELKKTLPVAQRRIVSRLFDDIDNHTYTLSQMEGPYFPLMRFGEHVVVAKSEMLRNAQNELASAREALSTLYNMDESEYTKEQLADAKSDVSKAQALVNSLKGQANHYLVEFYESKTEAENRVKQLGEFFKDDPTMQVGRRLREAHFRELDSAPYGFMKKLQDEIAANLPDKDSAAIRQAVRDLYIRQMPERAALKQQLKRLTVRGVKQGEMRRAIIASGLRNSFNISRMMYISPLNKALATLRSGESDTEKLLGEEMAKRMVDSLTPPVQSKVLNALSNVSYITMLGLSPSFVALNMTQPWVVSLPLIAARHGIGAGGAQLAKATAEVAGLMKQSWAEARKGTTLARSLRFEPDLNLLKDAGERQMIKDLMDRGIIDVTQEHDLSAMANGDAQGITDVAAKWSAIPAHHTEVVNRIATALAAYRMERQLDLKNGTNNATSYAEKIVADSHLDYTAENAPRLMRSGMFSGAGKLIFQFKKYQQGMIFLNFKLLRDAIKEGKITGEAGKAWMYLMAGQMAIAGTAGLPFFGILAGLASVVAGMGGGDEDKDFKLAFYNGLKDAVGETTARLIMKGAPAAFLNIDVSNRAGMGDLLNPVKFARVGNNGHDTVAGYLMALAGPTASIAANYTDAYMKAANGDYRDAVRTVMPRFIQGPMDAMQMAEEGMITKRGNRYVAPEDVGTWDIIAKGLTFTSTDQRDLAENKAAFETAVHNRDSARHNLLNKYSKASLRGEDMTDIMEQIAEFNKKYPAKGERIDQGTLMKSRRAQQVYERDLRNGVRVQKNNARLAEEMGITK